MDITTKIFLAAEAHGRKVCGGEGGFFHGELGSGHSERQPLSRAESPGIICTEGPPLEGEWK